MNPKKWPEVAEARKKTADDLRNLRKINPKMARMVYQRMAKVRMQLINDCWSGQ